jgi:hypothetical protein
MGEHSREGVIFRSTSFEGINDSLVATWVRFLEDAVTNTGQDHPTKSVRFGDECSQHRESPKRKANCVYLGSIAGQVLKEPLREIRVRFWVVRFVLVSVTKQRDADYLAADVFQEGINSRLLPGIAKRACPAVDKDNGDVLRRSHADTVVS